jgi:RNA polymerase sigma-70 factor (ECF subfamily)
MKALSESLTLPPHGVFMKLLQRLEETVAFNEAEGATRAPDRDTLSDEALVESIVRRGNRQHFRVLLARYKVKVHHIALSVLGPAFQAQAEDIAQEVFIKLYQRLESFRGDSSFSTWLYRLTINTAIDFQRKQERFSWVDIDEVRIPAVAPTDISTIGLEQLSTRLKDAIQTLSQTQRMMVYLFYWLEYKIREIAEIMGCPEGTVKVYLSRAKKHLAAELGELSDE